MKILFLVSAHILATFAKLLRPGGAKTLVSENLLLKQQLALLHNSSCERICALLTHTLPDPDGFRHPNTRHSI
jgi:hypothetical protein